MGVLIFYKTGTILKNGITIRLRNINKNLRCPVLPMTLLKTNKALANFHNLSYKWNNYKYNLQPPLINLFVLS